MSHQYQHQHQYQDLIALFEQKFYQSHNTRLIKGGDEPFYSPADQQCNYHQIIFAHGYYASALHEISHWCIAGKKRRLLADFGYWYEPDGRNEQQQKTFEHVEIKPQALEWAFCVAAQKTFNVSADNLSGFAADSVSFKMAVYQQVLVYLASDFPERGKQFIASLASFYQTPFPLTKEQFVL